MTAPLVLGFDTSAAHCAAAVLSGDRVLAARHEDMAKGQAERLLGLLQDVLAETGHDWQDLTAIGVGIGPGNFTGIRIGVSAARGLALALGVPAVGVSTLEALALDTAGPVLALADARRGSLYAQRFGDDPLPPRMVGADALPPALRQEGLVCIGAGARDVAFALGAHTAVPVHPLEQAIARIAVARHATTTDRPAPLDLRAPAAAPPRNPAPALLP